ncbi:MAG: vanadium-dependent haloperoxidase [Aquaticitalea sp.]
MKFFKVIVALVLLSSCKKSEPIVITADEYSNAIDKVVDIMVHDIFSPPVASRIFAYPNIAAYEIIAMQNPKYNSLSGQIAELTPIPKPKNPEQINFQLAALIAHMDLSRQLVFSEDRITSYRDSLYKIWQDKNPEIFKNSKDYALEVNKHIGEWMNGDHYKQTRTMSKFNINSEDVSRWEPTPPSYLDGLEPHWMNIRTFVMDSSSQFKPIPPPKFSMEEGSDFHKELMEVYDTTNKMIEEGDTAEEVQMAKFWDCNPYVTVTRGHLMFATKKITPGAHWIGITKIACKKTNMSFDDTVYAYTKTSIALFEAFISCWDEKYRSNLVRPETLINKFMNDNWKPLLQTPPFPEYSSGHSVASGAGSTVLTSIFGKNFQFDDDTEQKFGLPIRNFKSFDQASEEAAISRMYGGIHYRAAIEQGLKQGREVGAFVVSKLKMVNE